MAEEQKKPKKVIKAEQCIYTCCGNTYSYWAETDQLAGKGVDRAHESMDKALTNGKEHVSPDYLAEQSELRDSDGYDVSFKVLRNKIQILGESSTEKLSDTDHGADFRSEPDKAPYRIAAMELLDGRLMVVRRTWINKPYASTDEAAYGKYFDHVVVFPQGTKASDLDVEKIPFIKGFNPKNLPKESHVRVGNPVILQPLLYGEEMQTEQDINLENAEPEQEQPAPNNEGTAGATAEASSGAASTGETTGGEAAGTNNSGAAATTTATAAANNGGSSASTGARASAEATASAENASEQNSGASAGTGASTNADEKSNEADGGNGGSGEGGNGGSNEGADSASGENGGSSAQNSGTPARTNMPLIPGGNIADYTNMYRFVEAVQDLMQNGEKAKMLCQDPATAADMNGFMPGNSVHLSDLIKVLEKHQHMFNFTKRLSKNELVAFYNYGKQIAAPGRQFPTTEDVDEAVKCYEDQKLQSTAQAEQTYQERCKAYDEAKDARKKEGRKVLGHTLGAIGAGALTLACPAVVLGGLISLVTVPAISLGWMTGGGIALFAAGVVAVKYVMPKCFKLFTKVVDKLKDAWKARKAARQNEKTAKRNRNDARSRYSACRTQEVVDRDLGLVSSTRYPGRVFGAERVAEDDPLLNPTGYENVAAQRARQQAQAQQAQEAQQVSQQAAPQRTAAAPVNSSAESEFSPEELDLFKKYESAPFMTESDESRMKSFVDANRDYPGFNADTFAERYNAWKKAQSHEDEKKPRTSSRNNEGNNKAKHDSPWLAMQCFDAIEGEPTEEQLKAIYERTGYRSVDEAKASYAKKKKISVDQINLDPAEGKQPNRPWLAKTISDVVGKENLSETYITRTGYSDPEAAKRDYARQRFGRVNSQVLEGLKMSSWSEFTAKSPEEAEKLWKDLDEKQKSNLISTIGDLSAEDAESLLKTLPESLLGQIKPKAEEEHEEEQPEEPHKDEEEKHDDAEEEHQDEEADKEREDDGAHVDLMNDKPEEMLILFDRYDKWLASQGRTWKGDDSLQTFVDFMTTTQGQEAQLANALYSFYKGKKQDEENAERERVEKAREQTAHKVGKDSIFGKRDRRRQAAKEAEAAEQTEEPEKTEAAEQIEEPEKTEAEATAKTEPEKQEAKEESKKPISKEEADAYDRFMEVNKEMSGVSDDVRAKMFENFAARNRIEADRAREIFAERSKPQAEVKEEQVKPAEEKPYTLDDILSAMGPEVSGNFAVFATSEQGADLVQQLRNGVAGFMSQSSYSYDKRRSDAYELVERFYNKHVNSKEREKQVQEEQERASRAAFEELSKKQAEKIEEERKQELARKEAEARAKAEEIKKQEAEELKQKQNKAPGNGSPAASTSKADEDNGPEPGEE